MKTGTTKGVRLDSPECASRKKDADAFDQIAKIEDRIELTHLTFYPHKSRHERKIRLIV